MLPGPGCGSCHVERMRQIDTASMLLDDGLRSSQADAPTRNASNGARLPEALEAVRTVGRRDAASLVLYGQNCPAGLSGHTDRLIMLSSTALWAVLDSIGEQVMQYAL